MSTCLSTCNQILYLESTLYLCVTAKASQRLPYMYKYKFTQTPSVSPAWVMLAVVCAGHNTSVGEASKFFQLIDKKSFPARTREELRTTGSAHPYR